MTLLQYIIIQQFFIASAFIKPNSKKFKALLRRLRRRNKIICVNLSNRPTPKALADGVCGDKINSCSFV